MILIKYLGSIFDYNLCGLLEVSKDNQISSLKYAVLHKIYQFWSIFKSLYLWIRSSESIDLFGLTYPNTKRFAVLHIQILKVSPFYIFKY